MRLVYVVDDLESITAWIDVLVCLYTVASDVDISLDLRLLQFIRSKKPSKHPETNTQGKGTYRFIVTPQDVQMRTFQDKVSCLPRVVPIVLLAHPAIMVGCTYLLKNTPSPFQVRSQSGDRYWSNNRSSGIRSGGSRTLA